MKLTAIIPVYNEKATIEAILRRVVEVQVDGMEKEIIVVDDGSRDGTREILQSIERDWASPSIKIYYHPQNRGKGAAVSTALSHTTGDLVIIQDADLEYQPEEYPILVGPILKYGADVVYGTRFSGVHRAFFFWHYLGNKGLTLLTNLLFDSMLSDMEVGYKAFRTEVIKSIRIEAKGFDFEPEITAKILKRKLRIFEVPITYSGRDYLEGKKITWRDGFIAIWTLLKYRLHG